jgi:peptidoglycan/xylan/chitin deacetylase (PgdA/CDA1 family)
MAPGELSFPVLMYHGLLRPGERAAGDRDTKYWLPAESFRAHLARIAAEGRRPRRLAHLWSGQDARGGVALTFDDGRDSDYEVAFPALADAGGAADFFVNTATIDTPGYLSWARIREMERAGLSFQSHSHDHIALLWLPAAALEHQLRQSKSLLEDRLGRPVDFLAVPYGLLNRRVRETARRVGYRAVCNSLSWFSRPGRPWINRIAIHRDTSPEALGALLRGSPLPFAARAARAAGAYLPKRVLLRVRPARLGVRVLEGRA